MGDDDNFAAAIDMTKQLGAHAKRMVKPKDIPIYGEQNRKVQRRIQEFREFKENSEPATLIAIIRDARLTVQDTYTQIKNIIIPIKDGIDGVIDTGKAHAQSTYQMIQDQQDTTINAGVIAGSGLLGFILGSFGRRARLFKRLVLTTAGAGSATAFCYPSEGEMIAKSAIEETNRLGLIAYNFVQGVQPKEITVKNVVDTNVLTEKTKAMPEEGDLGQGNPADKDMYSTRGS